MVQKNKEKATVQNPENPNTKPTSFSQPIKSWIDMVNEEEEALINKSPEKQLQIQEWI